jgi:DNA-binding CsgD family transcriptional regulator
VETGTEGRMESGSFWVGADRSTLQYKVLTRNGSRDTSDPGLKVRRVLCGAECDPYRFYRRPRGSRIVTDLFGERRRWDGRVREDWATRRGLEFERRRHCAHIIRVNRHLRRSFASWERAGLLTPKQRKAVMRMVGQFQRPAEIATTDGISRAAVDDLVKSVKKKCPAFAPIYDALYGRRQSRGETQAVGC